MDVTMAANFTISDSDSEPPEEVEEGGNDQPAEGKVEPLRQRHALTLPELRSAGGPTESILGQTCRGQLRPLNGFKGDQQPSSKKRRCKHFLLLFPRENESHTPFCFNLSLAAHGRIRLNSESHASTISREEELQVRGEEEAGTPTEGLPFRSRSYSAPPALWAAKKYGRQLRRMSDEFVTLLDKGELRKVSSAGTNGPIHHSRSWWNYLFSHQETEGETSHHENHAPRTE
ncbi:BCL2 associated agonist of cell death b [Fundulus diaphanus]